jgi:3-hydroxyisobutyrate dehydrogenase-like beta-hydroxyacid dehydrogenase
MKVGFVGLGQMGSGMAASLLKAGHEVIVYNRTPAKAEPLIAKGARAVASIAEACREGAVLTMLANDKAVESVVLGKGGIIDSLPKGGIHISSSTISVALSEALATAHAKAGQRFVAASVSPSLSILFDARHGWRSSRSSPCDPVVDRRTLPSRRPQG